MRTLIGAALAAIFAICTSFTVTPAQAGGCPTRVVNDHGGYVVRGACPVPRQRVVVPQGRVYYQSPPRRQHQRANRQHHERRTVHRHYESRTIRRERVSPCGVSSCQPQYVNPCGTCQTPVPAMIATKLANGRCMAPHNSPQRGQMGWLYPDGTCKGRPPGGVMYVAPPPPAYLPEEPPVSYRN